MISLGSHRLHRGVYWENELNQVNVQEDTFYDLDGFFVSQRMAVRGGNTINLVAQGSANGGTSFFTRGFLDYVLLLELSGEEITFVYGDVMKQVTIPANPLEVTPLRQMAGHTSSDIYYGKVKIREIE